MKSFKLIMAFISSFLLVFSLVFFTVSFIVSSFFSKETMILVTKKIDVSQEIEKVKNSGNAGRETKVSNVIVDLYELPVEFGVSKKDVYKIINSYTVKKIIGTISGNIFDYIVNGKNHKIISAADVYENIDDNFDFITKETKIDISDSQKDKFLNRLKLELPDALESIPSVEEIGSKKYGDKIKIINYVFSLKFRILSLVLCILSVVMLIVIKREKSLLYILFSFLIFGLIIVIFSLCVPGILLSLIKNVEISLFVNVYVRLLSNQLFWIGIITCFLDLVILLLKNIIEKRVQ